MKDIKNSSIFIKTSFFVFLYIILAKIFGYLFRIIVAREDLVLYGNYNLAMSLIGLVIPFLLLGFQEGIVRNVSFYNTKKDTKYSRIIINSTIKISFFFSVIVAIIIYIFSSQISSLFNAEIATLLKFLSPVIPLIVLTKIFQSILKANRKPALGTLLEQFVPNLLRLIILLIFFYFGIKLFGIIFSFLFSYLVAVLILFMLTSSFFKFSSKLDLKIVQYSWPLIFVTASIGLMGQIDTLFLGLFTNIEEVSLYNVAYPTAQMLTILSTSILSLYLPTITEKYAKNFSMEKDSFFVSKLIFISSFTSLLVILIFNKLIISVLFGKEYLQSSTPLIILATAYLFYNISQTSYNILLMKEKTKTLSIIFIISLSINVMLNLILIPSTDRLFNHGMYGAATATLISFMFLTFFLKKESKK